MSNPFRDADPFGQPMENPFSDPSVQSAAVTGDAAAIPQGDLPATSGFSPFSSANPSDKGFNAFPDHDTEIKVEPTAPAIPPPSSGKSKKSSSDIQSTDKPVRSESTVRRSTELDKKEQELAIKERELAEREAAAQSKAAAPAGTTPEVNNFPPCYPLMHHDIAQDIPNDNRWLVRMTLYLFFWMIVAFIWNLICMCAIFSAGIGNNGPGFGLSIAYLLLGLPLSFLCWYRPLYNSFKKNSPTRLYIAMGIIFLNFLFSIAIVVGFPQSGMAGAVLIGSDGVFGKNNGIGIMVVVNIVVWALAIIGSIYIFFYARRSYRNFGGNAAAKKEVAASAGEEIAKNPSMLQSALSRISFTGSKPKGAESV